MRAIIIERWAILRYGLRAVLGQAGHPVLSAASSAAEGLDAVAGARNLELVIAGSTDDDDLADLVATLVQRAPQARVIALADQPELVSIEALLGAGASGILARLAEGSEVLDAIERVQRGERVLSSEVIDTLVGALDSRSAVTLTPAPRAVVAPSAALTAREREILALLVTGATNRTIAAKLFIGEATVKTHLASAYAKLGVGNRHQAVARGIELGLVSARAAS